MTLRDRAKALYSKLTLNARFRQGDPVQDIVDFAIAERGYQPETDGTHALVLYFASKADSDYFVDVIQAAKPGMITRAVS